MGAKFEITDPAGRVRLVDRDDDEILRDGERLRVPLLFRDAALSPMQRVVADAAMRFDDGGGGRPGTQFDYVAAARVKEVAYQAAKAELRDAWRTPAPVADASSRPDPAPAAPPVKVEDARPAIPVTDADFARLRQIRDESYRAMVAEMGTPGGGRCDEPRRRAARKPHCRRAGSDRHHVD